MRKLAVMLLLVSLALCGAGAWGAAEQPQGEVEKAAEAQIASVRDMIVDALWMKTDEYWHGGVLPGGMGYINERLQPIVAICRLILQLDPQFADCYATAAWVSLQLGNDEDAVAFWEAGIAACPDNWELPHELGLLYYTYHTPKRDLEKALVYLKRAAEMPSPVRIKKAYPYALTKLGRYQEAAAEWHKILELDPNDRAARRELEKLRAAGKIGPED